MARPQLHATIVVTGVPQPQGSKTAFTTKHGKTVLVEGRRGPARAQFHSWREAVTYEARRACEEYGTLTGPVMIGLSFRFAQTKSDPYRREHSTRPDLDKLTRAVLDGLTGSGIIADDSRVSRLHAEKHHVQPGDSPGVTVELYDLAAIEDSHRADAKAEAAAVRRALRGAS